MNKSLLFLLVSVFFEISANAQVPQSLPFQGIARDVNGVPLPNQFIGVRLSIHDSITTGTTVYQERDTVTTSNLGLFTLNVGTGTALSGTFSAINWGNNSKYIQVELDTSGGTTYTNLGTSKMLSVPYALYAGTSGNPLTNSHVFVGDSANVPTDVALSGDVSISNTGVTTVNTVNGGLNLGGWVLISSATASNSSSVDFTGLTSAYYTYVVIMNDVVPAINTGSVCLLLGTGSGPTWHNASSDYNYIFSITRVTTGGGASTGGYGGQGSISLLTDDMGNATGQGASVIFYLDNPSQTSLYHRFYGEYGSSFTSSSTYQASGTFSGQYNSTTAVTAIRFLIQSGNITSGTFKLYGIK